MITRSGTTLYVWASVSVYRHGLIYSPYHHNADNLCQLIAKQQILNKTQLQEPNPELVNTFIGPPKYHERYKLSNPARLFVDWKQQKPKLPN